jgi:hypothetical protein
MVFFLIARHLFSFKWILSRITPNVLVNCARQGAPIRATHMKLKDYLARTGILVTCLFAIASCGVSQKHWGRVETLMSGGNLSGAAQMVSEQKKSEYGERNAVLFYLDQGIILHHLGKYKESTASFDKAETLIEDLYTKSVTNQAASLATNENLVPYDGEDFEEALLNLFTCLNFAYQGDWENALVEGRQVDHQLQVLSDRYGKENKGLKAGEPPTKVVYTEDAFVRYLMGVFFEAKGEDNDATVFYRKSYQAYQTYARYYKTKMPDFVVQDLMRMLEYSGIDSELTQIQKAHPNLKPIKKTDFRKMAQIVFIHMSGFAPYKEEIIVGAGKYGYIGGPNLALPYFKARPPLWRFSLLEVTGAEAGQTLMIPSELMEDVTAIAIRNLEDRYPSIVRRALARLVIKETAKAATRKMSKSKDDSTAVVGTLLNLGTSITAWATEHADRRSFRLLPAQIHVARVFVKPGEYELSATIGAYPNSQAMKKNLGKVSLAAGQLKVVGMRTYE